MVASRALSSGSRASYQYYVIRAASGLVNYAAILGLYTLSQATDEFVKDITYLFEERDFEEERRDKTIELGKVFERIGPHYG